MGRLSSAGIAGVLALACVAVYWNALRGPFVYDDELAIRDNRSIREWRVPEMFVAEQDSPTAGRPFVNASFALTYATSGLDVRAYHATNLAIHMFCAIAFFALVSRTLRLPRMPEAFRRRSTSIAFASALLWAVHPLNSEVVDYVTQRSESLMALFYLVTIYAAARAATATEPGRWQLCGVAACAVGMLCKESMATAPLMVVAYERAYIFDSMREALRRRNRFYLALASTWGVLALLLWSNPRGESAGFGSHASPWTYLLNQTVMLTEYLRHAFWPKNLVAGYGWMMPFTLADVGAQAVFIAVLVVLAVTAWLVRPQLGFLGVWFFVTLAPTSSIVPIPIEVGAERRMYLPLMSIVVLAAIAIWRLSDVVTRRWLAPHRAAVQYGFVAVTIVLSIGLGLTTIERNREYATPLTLYRTVVERWPTSLSHHILGSALLAIGSDRDAEEHLRVAITGAPRAHYDLGVALFNQGKLDEAVDHLQNVISIWESPPASHPYWQAPLRADVVGASLLIGRAFARRESWVRAAEQFERAASMAPNDLEARNLLASASFSAHSFDRAIVNYRVYLQSRPDDVTALTNFGIALISTGHDEDGIAAFRRAVEVDPANGSSQRNLANALFDRGDMVNAAKHAAEAVRLRPQDPDARELLSRAQRESLDATRQRH